MPPLWLPTLSDAVRRFQLLVREKLGLDLDFVTAREEATRVLHMSFLREHAFRSMKIVPAPRPKVGRPRKAEGRSAELTEAPRRAAIDASSLVVGEEETLYEA